LNEPLVIARAFHLASTLLLAGTISFRVFVAAPAFRGEAGGRLQDSVRIRLTRIIWAALIVATISGAAWLVFLAGEIGGLSVGDALSEGLAWIVLTQTQFGIDWMVRMTMASLLAMLLLLPTHADGWPPACWQVSPGPAMRPPPPDSTEPFIGAATRCTSSRRAHGWGAFGRWPFCLGTPAAREIPPQPLSHITRRAGFPFSE